MFFHLHKIKSMYSKKDFVVLPAKELYTPFSIFKKIKFDMEFLKFLFAYVALERDYQPFLQTGDVSFKWFIIRLIASLKRINHLTHSEYQKMHECIFQDFSNIDNVSIDIETPKSIFAQQVIFKALLEVCAIPKKESLTVDNLTNEKMLFRPLPLKFSNSQQDRMHYYRSFDYLMKYSRSLNNGSESIALKISQLHYYTPEEAFNELKIKENLTEFEENFNDLYNGFHNSLIKKILRNEI